MKIDTSNTHSVCVYSFALSVYGTLPQRHVHCFAVSIYFRSHTSTHTNFTHFNQKRNEEKKKKYATSYIFLGDTIWGNVAHVCAWYAKDNLKYTMSMRNK